MPDNTGGLEDSKVFREALRRWDAENAPTTPTFNSIYRYIIESPSPLNAPRWSARRSLRLSIALTAAQVRIVPWLVFPVALGIATAAVYSARFFGLTQGTSAGLSGFASTMLVSIAATVTIALSTYKPDAVCLATPLGPQVVVLSRLVVVLTVDTVTGVVASALVAANSFAGTFANLLVGWMAPSAIIAGSATFVAIWVTPWAGSLLALSLIPFVSPAASTSLGAATGILWTTLTPPGLLIAGLAVLTAAIASARTAATRHQHVLP
ncbi:hypothetical protein [Actinomyces ruminis]|uniref:hypothetical protein n=1 Tax=Actinomyces ruminis TaxID=1937003 RepID=UPI000B69F8C8|nr:hypothetical protein [Actinomyces ruminis]